MLALLVEKPTHIHRIKVMAYTEVGRVATNKYRAKFDIVQIRVQQGKRDKIAEHALERGESINQFINRAIDETILRDSR